MSMRRGPWLVMAVMLLGAAAAAFRATYLYWTPCQGTMLDGTILFPRMEFSDA